MGHYDGLCFLSLCSLAIVLVSHVTGDYLVLFRGKSKHTALIAPFDKWTLPEEELKSCYGRSFIDRYLFHPDSLPIGKGDTFRRLVVQNANSLTVDLNEFKAEPSLIFACQKCILLHGLFEIWSEGNSVDDVVAKAGTSEHYLEFSKRCEQQCESSSVHRSVSFRIAASVLEQPWLPSETLNESILSKFDNMRSKLFTNPTNRLNSADDGADLDFDMRVYVDEVSGYCVLCRHLARGLAAPSKSGANIQLCSHLKDSFLIGL